ncbi:MAG: hypothetical protein KJZ78_19515 [Bryobacteraceae bacterium]|nr:hypothetical protein [Bryobacteraceae bacterium]
MGVIDRPAPKLKAKVLWLLANAKALWLLANRRLGVNRSRHRISAIEASGIRRDFHDARGSAVGIAAYKTTAKLVPISRHRAKSRKSVVRT